MYGRVANHNSSTRYSVISVRGTHAASRLPRPYELQCPIIWEEHTHLMADPDTNGPTKTVLRCFLPLLATIAMSSLTQLCMLELYAHLIYAQA